MKKKLVLNHVCDPVVICPCEHEIREDNGPLGMVMCLANRFFVNTISLHIFYAHVNLRLDVRTLLIQRRHI